MGYTVTVDIKSSDFPGLGNPAYPKDYSEVKDSLPKEIKNKVKDQYESYYRNANKARMSVSSHPNFKSAINPNELCVQFDYEEGVPKTYKFLGMDIDDNYESVILLGDGYVRVAPMFDSIEISNQQVGAYGSRYDSSTIDMANDIIMKHTQDLARTLSTAMKNGILYDIFRQQASNFDPISGSSTPVKLNVSDVKSLRLENLDPLVQLIKNKIGSNSSDSAAASTGYKSVLLNLVEKEKRRDQESKFADTGKNADLDSTVAAAVLCKIFNYWAKVIDNYCSYNSVLSEIDLWSNLGKAVMGETAFNSQMRQSGILIQNKDTGEIADGRILSFAGVARDNGINDANTIRISVQDQLRRMVSVVSGDTSSTEVVMQDIMLGNITYEEFEDPYTLSAEELQAVSSYDSLKYIDEDAQTCRESYNMNDPEDRSLFIKSAIKSYDRNFRAFKSKDDYDVAQAFSDMVEKGVTFSDRIVSKDEVADVDLTSYEVTATPYAIDRVSIKKSLVKMGRLLNKSLTEVNDLFTMAQKSAPNP